MISCRDLMLGDWVYDQDDVPHVICEILGYDYICIREGNNYTSKGILSEFIHPIPVTPELLERIGFEYVESKGTELWKEWYYLAGNYKLLVRDISNSPSKEWYVHIDNADFDSIGSGDFQYLHELQNLVRVITGKDLPITKEMLG